MCSAENVVQIIIATAHPAKFNAAVDLALAGRAGFDFDRDVMPKEFEGLLDLPRRMFDVANGTEPVKAVIAREVSKLMLVNDLAQVVHQTASL